MDSPPSKSNICQHIRVIEIKYLPTHASGAVSERTHTHTHSESTHTHTHTHTRTHTHTHTQTWATKRCGVERTRYAVRWEQRVQEQRLGRGRTRNSFSRRAAQFEQRQSPCTLRSRDPSCLYIYMLCVCVLLCIICVCYIHIKGMFVCIRYTLYIYVWICYIRWHPFVCICYILYVYVPRYILYI